MAPSKVNISLIIFFTATLCASVPLYQIASKIELITDWLHVYYDHYKANILDSVGISENCLIHLQAFADEIMKEDQSTINWAHAMVAALGIQDTDKSREFCRLAKSQLSFINFVKTRLDVKFCLLLHTKEPVRAFTACIPTSCSGEDINTLAYVANLPIFADEVGCDGYKPKKISPKGRDYNKSDDDNESTSESWISGHIFDLFGVIALVIIVVCLVYYYKFYNRY